MHSVCAMNLCSRLDVGADFFGFSLVRIIRQTKRNPTTSVPKTQSEKLIVDIDLCILGENQGRFQEYESQIPKEY